MIIHGILILEMGCQLHRFVTRKKSIIAALNPVNSDYLYFVADKKGGHFFAKTLKEHNKNINYTKKNTLSKLNDNSSIFFSDNDLPLSKPKNK